MLWLLLAVLGADLENGLVWCMTKKRIGVVSNSAK